MVLSKISSGNVFLDDYRILNTWNVQEQCQVR